MSLNKVLLLGHVGKDPDIFHFQNGGSIASFSLATTERGFKTRDGKEVPPRTEWHNVRLSNGLATIAEQYIKKGSRVLIEGKIRHRDYEAQDGTKRYITEIHADSMEMLGGPANQTSDNRPAGQPVNNISAPVDYAGSADDMNPKDDLPF